MKTLLSIACTLFITVCLNAQPTLTNQFSFGNRGNSVFSDMKVTKDKGLIIAGYADTAYGADKTERGYGGRDYWIIKVDSFGHKQWDRTLGGSDQDIAYSVIPTQDGNYLIGGTSASNISGTKTQNRIGDNDVWLVKLDNSGNILWDKTIGSSQGEGFVYLDTTLDGNYIVGTASPYGISGDKTSKGVGSMDYWILKVDPAGNLLWNKAFGGTSFDNVRSIKHTEDGGYIVGGISSSNIGGNKTENSRGNSDYWVIKLNSNGNIEWDKTLGTDADYDELTSVVQVRDGGYVACGYTSGGISGDKTSASKGLNDIWIVRLSIIGKKQADLTIGGNLDDDLGTMITTADGGVAIACSSASGINGDKTEASRGDLDYWLIKLDRNANIQWDKTVGGNTADYCYGLVEYKPNVYEIGGWSYSRPSGDRTAPARGVPDMWITGVAYKPGAGVETTIAATNELAVTAYPNPAANNIIIQGLPSKQKVKITVVDVSGNIKMQTESHTNIYNLNISTLNRGNYILNIEVNGKLISKKFMKE